MDIRNHNAAIIVHLGDSSRDGSCNNCYGDKNIRSIELASRLTFRLCSDCSHMLIARLTNVESTKGSM